MNRDEKVAKVAELSDSFAKAKFAVVADYRGLKVTEFEQLRGALRQTNAEVRVAKNSLLRLAVKDSDYEILSDSFTGTTAIALSYDEPVGSAKALSDFAKDHEKLEIRGAAMEGKLLNKDDVVALSKLPSKEQLLGQLCGVLQAVPTGLVNALSGVPRNLVYALQAIKEQKEN